MSTLMSVDMNIERSSTRLHAPPGGKTSICFGDYDSSQLYSSKSTPKPNQHQTALKPSMSDLLSSRSSEEEEDVDDVKKVVLKSTSSQMDSIFSSENEAPKPNTRVRQAPGGKSSLVLG